MKTLRYFLTSLFTTCALALAAHAADANPLGLWSWTAHGPQGPLTIKARLEVTAQALTGVIITPGGELPIAEGTFKDGTLNFTIIREVQGEKLHVKYSGKLDGDKIAGTIDRPMPGGGEHQVVDWNATRQP